MQILPAFWETTCKTMSLSSLKRSDAYLTSPAAKIIFNYKIINAEGKIVCTGETIQVFVDDNNDLSLTFPPFFKAWKDSNKLI